jgi:hypothetical protein
MSDAGYVRYGVGSGDEARILAEASQHALPFAHVDVPIDDPYQRFRFILRRHVVFVVRPGGAHRECLGSGLCPRVPVTASTLLITLRRW